MESKHRMNVLLPSDDTQDSSEIFRNIHAQRKQTGKYCHYLDCLSDVVEVRNQKIFVLYPDAWNARLVWLVYMGCILP